MRRFEKALIPVVLGAAVVGGIWLRTAPAQNAPAAQPAAGVRIATADVLGIVERMILSDRYRPAQEAFTTGQNNALKPLADELVAMETRGAQLQPNSPELQALTQQYDQKRDAFAKARQEAMGKIDAFNTDQVREAYRLTLAAAGEMADKLGYSHVLASRTGPALIRSDNVAGALQEILARPVVKSDPADDLTDRLIKQFKLENVKLEETPKLGTPTPPPSPTQAPPAPPPVKK